MPALTTKQISGHHKAVPAWSIHSKSLQRTFQFKDFLESTNFVKEIATKAQELNHHPDVDIRFDHVSLTLTTHDEGGITEKDFGLAKQCDAVLAKSFAPRIASIPTPLNYRTHKSVKNAATDHPILRILAERWSPYSFADRPVAESDLRSLFEAARWAASSYNEQPWNYLVAGRENPLEFERMLGCLVEANQTWAKAAPLLVLSVVSLQFAKNKQDNRAAVHDLGLASGNLVIEATERGLSVHQMIGILPDKAREVYQIPEHFEAWTAMAIGYADDPSKMAEALMERDLTPRQRKRLSKFVFTGQWGQPSPFGLNRDA